MGFWDFLRGAPPPLPSVDALTFDLAGATLEETSETMRGWLSEAKVATKLRLFSEPIDWPFDLRDPGPAAAFYRAQCADNGGVMLSVDPIEIDGVEALRQAADASRGGPLRLQHRPALQLQRPLLRAQRQPAQHRPQAPVPRREDPRQPIEVPRGHQAAVVVQRQIHHLLAQAVEARSRGFRSTLAFRRWCRRRRRCTGCRRPSPNRRHRRCCRSRCPPAPSRSCRR